MHKIRFLITYFLIVGSLIFLFRIGYFPVDNKLPPSDEQMISNFNKNRAVFEKLQTMICRDNFQVVSMDPEWSKPDNISDSKKQEYYELFKLIGVSQIQSYDNCRMSYSVWSVGWAGDADYKKYEYKPSKPENIVDSLENLPLNNNNIAFYFRKIDNDWFISYSHWP